MNPVKHIFSLRGLALAALFAWLSSGHACACAACFGDTSGSKMGQAATWGIAAMVVIVFGMLAAIASFGFYLNYRAKHPLPDYQELLGTDEGQLKPGTSS